MLSRPKFIAKPGLQVYPPKKHSRTRTIRGSKATSIVCRINLERKYQCTSSQQFENWYIFGHCSRPCKTACLTVWGLSIVYWIQCNCNPTLLADADGPRIWVAITVADADRLRTWCLRTRIICRREIGGSAHLWYRRRRCIFQHFLANVVEFSNTLTKLLL